MGNKSPMPAGGVVFSWPEELELDEGATSSNSLLPAGIHQLPTASILERHAD